MWPKDKEGGRTKQTRSAATLNTSTTATDMQGPTPPTPPLSPTAMPTLYALDVAKKATPPHTALKRKRRE